MLCSNSIMVHISRHMCHSDCLVEEAVGGRSAARCFLHKDEKGYHDTEVM